MNECGCEWDIDERVDRNVFYLDKRNNTWRELTLSPKLYTFQYQDCPLALI